MSFPLSLISKSAWLRRQLETGAVLPNFWCKRGKKGERRKGGGALVSFTGIPEFLEDIYLSIHLPFTSARQKGCGELEGKMKVEEEKTKCPPLSPSPHRSRNAHTGQVYQLEFPPSPPNGTKTVHTKYFVFALCLQR